jgi:ATP-dependent protease ClpP protease subunit
LRLLAVCLSLLLAACSCATPSALGDPSIYAPGPVKYKAAKASKPTGAVSIPVTEFDAAFLNPAADKFDELVDEGETKIWLQIDSFGGSIFDGMDFIKRIEDAKKRNPGVKTVCAVDVKAYSMGWALLQSGACDERVMTKRSTLLAHNASGGTKGTADQMEEDAELVRELSNALAEMCAARLKISVDEYKAKIDRRAWTFGWEKAVEIGGVDRVVDPSDIPPTADLPIKIPFDFGF